MKHPIVRDLRDESGIALLVAVMLMLMVSAVALSALDRARQENLGSTAGRRKVATLIAADAGLRLVEDQLINGAGSTPDTAPIADTAFISFGNGLATSFRTGEIGSSAALPILKVGSTVKEGGQLNVGGAGTFSYGVYRGRGGLGSRRRFGPAERAVGRSGRQRGLLSPGLLDLFADRSHRRERIRVLADRTADHQVVGAGAYRVPRSHDADLVASVRARGSHAGADDLELGTDGLAHRPGLVRRADHAAAAGFECEARGFDHLAHGGGKTGQAGHAEHAYLVARAPNRRPQHLEPALTVRGEHAHAGAAVFARRCFNHHRNVVQLRVEEDAASRPRDRAHGFGANGREKLEAELEERHLAREAPHPDMRLVEAGNVEREDDRVLVHAPSDITDRRCPLSCLQRVRRPNGRSRGTRAAVRAGARRTRREVGSTRTRACSNAPRRARPPERRAATRRSAR